MTALAVRSDELDTADIRQHQFEDLSPVHIEKWMRRLRVDLVQAQNDLRAARDAEVEAKHGYRRQYRQAMAKAPKVRRDEMTVAQRDAWVEEQCADAEFDYDMAKAKREAAKEYMDTLNTQSMLVMALGKSVQQSYNTAGYGP